MSLDRSTEPFCLEIDFVREEVDLVGAGRSFLLLELAEFDLAFSPLAEEDVSDLFERRDRLSTGMFCERRRAEEQAGAAAWVSNSAVAGVKDSKMS
jgi:hypothetical protein